jgi:PAS domain S-box-containing protein
MSPTENRKTRNVPGRLDAEENRLWRLAMWFLVLLAVALSALLWERLESIPYHLGAIAPGLLVLAVLFAAYAYGRRREVSDLKVLLKDLEDKVGAAPSEEQLDQLSELIARSQRNFKELIDSFEDVALAFSLDGTIRTVNRRVAELLRQPYVAVVGHKLDEFCDRPTRGEVEGTIARFLERRRWTGLIEVKLKGQPRALFLDCVLNAILKDGEVVGASLLARDVTEEREKERRFTELFETLQEGVYFCTPQSKLLDANPALIRMLGYSNKEELLAVDPATLSKGAALGRGPADSGDVRSREIVLKKKDGSDAVCLDISRAVWDPSGNVVRYQGTLTDVTERRRMETQLQAQTQFQQRLLESFPDLILVIDPDGRYQFVSSRIHDLLGYQPSDLLRQKVAESRNHSPEFLALYEDVASGERAVGASEFGAQHRDGAWRTMRATASRLIDANEKPAGVIVSVRDITMEKRLEQQVIQSERLAAMGQMIGGFAHELNNPLTTILGVSELLGEGESNESRQKQITMMHQQARRATEIVQNLMYFARPPAPGRTQVNLAELIERTVHLQAYSLRKSNISVDLLKEPALPSITADPNQLMQVFLNLILNAEQAIRESRERGTLRIRMGKDSGVVWATLQDDGPGIPAENLPHIFDPFYTTKRPGGGTGLGLSICKAIMKEHGGNIEAGAAPGGGAVFTVSLPVPAAG